ncbi:hypothetical protein X801_08654, partial [Opisthorchis viverrini]
MNLLNKTLALMEEPRITQLTVNDFKELLGGNPFDIHVKHQKDERLERLPVLITTNNPLTYYVMDADGKAILERCFYFKFHVKVGSTRGLKIIRMEDEWKEAIRGTHPGTWYLQSWTDKLAQPSQLFWAALGAGTQPMELLALGVFLIEHYTYIKTVAPRVLGLTAGFSFQALLHAWDQYKLNPLYRIELSNRLTTDDPLLPNHEMRRQSTIGKLIGASREFDYARYTGSMEDFLETRAKSYPRTTPIPPTEEPPQIERPPTIKPEPPSKPPTTTSIKPEEHETKPTTTTTTTTGHTTITTAELEKTTLTPEEVTIMETKRQRLDTQEDESYGSNLAVAKHAQSLFGIHYYKTDVTVTRKQHLTLAQYKPADTEITQYYVTCIPYQIFEFWT